jgi:PAS domain S-box-containing protein
MTDLAPQPRPPRVVVVEDDPGQLQTVTDLLTDEGFDVRGYPTADAVLTDLAAGAAAAAVVDVRLPDMDGNRLLDRLRKIDPRLRVILHTAYGSFGSARDAVNDGAFGYVEKLGDPAELIRQVHRAVADHAVRHAADLEAEVAVRTAALRASEARVRKEREFLDAAVDSLTGVFYVLSEAGRFVRWNRTFEEVTGYTAEEFAGLNAVDLFRGEERQTVADCTVKAFAEGRSSLEANLVSKDGRSTPYFFTARMAVLDGAPRLIGMGIDISHRRRLEEQFRQSQKMEAVGRLAGGVAHDFNNLLTVITGYSELLAERLPTDDPNRELLAEVRKAGLQAASLTRQLLALSRKQVLEPKVLDLNALIQDNVRMLRRLVGEDVDLRTDLAPAPGLVRADPGQIEQVLLNLTVNARDAMPRGGTLTIETRAVDVGPADAPPGRYVVVAVTDTGVGIPPEVMANLFEPFFSTKGAHGTGLGLAVVHGVVKQSGGHVEVASAIGAGTTFRVYLPALTGSRAAAKSESTLAPPPPGTETILLVEDEPSVQALTLQVLRHCGYTVLAASSGAEALAVAAGHRLDLVVTDVVMPGMSGREVVEKLREQDPWLKVLFVSGYTDDAVVRHGVVEVEVAYLQKPFTPRGLAQKIRDVLDAP